MATIKYKGVGIRAISACVPKNVSKNSELGYLIPEEEIEKTINSIGIKEKRYVDEDVTASDLCFKAAEKLFEDNNIDRSSIDMDRQSHFWCRFSHFGMFFVKILPGGVSIGVNF